MKYIVSGSEMNRIDEFAINEIGIPQMVLMERAALCVYNHIKSKFNPKAKILIVVEGGNNGADGIALARMLLHDRYNVEVFYIDGIKTSSAFDMQYSIAKKLGVNFIDEIVDCGYDVVVDAVFGVGLSRTITGKQAETINIMNEIDGYKLAVDIPSGIDSSTGFVLGTAFKSDTTITFGLMKEGLLTGLGSEYGGKIIVEDIGIPQKAVDFVRPRYYTYEEADLDKLLPYRKIDSHKGSFGKIGIIGGSKNMAGAAMFSAEAAYRMGCGLVRVCTTEENREIMQINLPEAMLTTYNPDNIDSVRKAVKETIKWSDVIVLGPGLGQDHIAEYITRKVLFYYEKHVVIDADGLNVLSKNMDYFRNTKAKLIITPHLMEMSRLTGVKTGQIKEKKYEIAREFSKNYGAIVVLKDARTVVSDGGTQAYINITGNNGMATGGSGDVLTGIIAGLLGQGMPMFEAAKLGVCMHGLAGQEAANDKGRYSMIARDIIRSITRVLESDYYVG